MNRELLIGCGANWSRLFSKDLVDLTTLDINPDHRPDVVWDLTQLPLPFDGDSFDAIHAYEVLEHTGSQGDYRFFFAQFEDFWRILKPGGILVGTAPAPGTRWVWGDPSHSRAIQPESFIFLDQTNYTAQVGRTPMSDFRYIYRADFSVQICKVDGDRLIFVLQVVKPSRICS